MENEKDITGFTRRGILGGLAARALALTTAVLGLTNKARADPFCCVLLYPEGGSCYASGGCMYLCYSNAGEYHLVCWTCEWQNFTYSCCECLDLDLSDCFDAEEENTICSCTMP